MEQSEDLEFRYALAGVASIPDTTVSRDDDTRPLSTATKIVNLLLESAQLLRDGDQTYASFIVNGHQETHRLPSTSFRRYIVHAYFEQFGKAPSTSGLAEALGTLEAKARFDGHGCTIATRCAEHDGKLYLDLTNDEWTAVEISADGWRIAPAAELPVRFVRSNDALPLPQPDVAGKLSDLDAFLPEDASAKAKIKGALVSALRPHVSQPVLAIIAPQGAGKSTLARFIKRVFDPAQSNLHGAPHEARDVTAAARNGYMLVFDNLSKIEPWLSDILCRLSTGGGFGGRQLYTNDEEVIFDAIRPMVLTAIEDVVVRGDLADRTLTIRLPARDDDASYKEEVALDKAFEMLRGRILGGLLTAASTALARLPGVRAKAEAGEMKLPRMADFALFATSAGQALGIENVSFVQLLREERAAAAGAVLESDVIFPYLCAVIDEKPFTGYPADLLRAINAKAAGDERSHRDRRWPTSPLKLKNQLKRLESDLHRAGIAITWLELDRHSKRQPFSIVLRTPTGPAERMRGGSPSLDSFIERETPESRLNGYPQNERTSPPMVRRCPQKLLSAGEEVGPFAETAETSLTASPSTTLTIGVAGPLADLTPTSESADLDGNEVRI